MAERRARYIRLFVYPKVSSLESDRFGVFINSLALHLTGERVTILVKQSNMLQAEH